MKNNYLIAGAAAAAGAFVVWQRGKAREVAKTAITEAEITDGTNWQGSMWQRLSALDLVSGGFPNLGGSVNAAPGRMEQANIGLNRIAGWDGGL